MTDFLKTVRERVVIYDGAMGTSIQKYQLSLDDYWGNEGFSEIIVLSRPDVIKEIHASYLQVGADVIETNTFGGTSIVLGEYNLQADVRKINIAAVQLAREAAEAFSTPTRPRFVAGSIGPRTKLPSLGHISYDDMAAALLGQAKALIEGGGGILFVGTRHGHLPAQIA